MYRRAYRTLLSNLPMLGKAAILTGGLWGYKHLSQKPFNLGTVSCTESMFKRNVFQEVLPQIIRIENNGEIVGYAYTFQDHLIVTAR